MHTQVAKMSPMAQMEARQRASSELGIRWLIVLHEKLLYGRQTAVTVSGQRNEPNLRYTRVMWNRDRSPKQSHRQYVLPCRMSRKALKRELTWNLPNCVEPMTALERSRARRRRYLLQLDWWQGKEVVCKRDVARKSGGWKP